jgi:hypothetical protein
MTPEAQEVVRRMQSLLNSDTPRNPYYRSDREWKFDVIKKMYDIKNGRAGKPKY